MASRGDGGKKRAATGEGTPAGNGRWQVLARMWQDVVGEAVGPRASREPGSGIRRMLHLGGRLSSSMGHMGLSAAMCLNGTSLTLQVQHPPT